MSRLEVLTLKSLSSLVNANGLYLVGYSWLFGMSIWITFFGGIIALKTLPKQQFGTLQHRVFPIYFIQSMLLSGALLTKWIYSHPDVLAYIMRPNVADVAQVYALATVLASQSFNYFIVGPMTSKIMLQRHKLEKEEGKQYSDPAVCPIHFKFR